MRRRTSILFLGLYLAAALPAGAQMSLSDIKAKLGEKTSELEEVDALLANPDRNQRLAAMELLLQSGNPTFIKRAKEIGLFSSDPEMQVSALRAIFEGGGPFKIEFTLTDDENARNGIIRWLDWAKGNWQTDGKLGSWTFQTDKYDAKDRCWKFKGNKNCALILSGNTVLLQDWTYGSGSLQLDSEGSLLGSFRHTNGSYPPVPARIPLAE